MNARDLLVRAKQLLQRGGPAGAMVIVPLAMAAQAQAATVPFTVGGASISQSATGGYFFGHVESALTGGGQGVELSGDTMPPEMPAPYSATPPYLPAGLAHQVGGTTTFYWTGGFGAGLTDLNTDALTVSYQLDLAAILSSQGHDFGDVSWTLAVGVYSSPDQDPGFQMAAFNASGNMTSGAASQSFAGSAAPAFTVSDQPQFWAAQLDVQWIIPTIPDPQVSGGATIAAFADDRLSATPLINISMTSDGPPVSSVPLPPAVWMGGVLLAGVMGRGLWQRRRAARVRI